MGGRRAQREGAPESVAIEVVSFETLALGHELEFPPPLAEKSAWPDSFTYHWKLLQFVFALPDPRAFPSVAGVWSSDDLTVLRRFCSAAEDLAESTLLAKPQGMTMRISKGGLPEIDRSFVSAEITRGFAVLFRQFYSHEERASFLKVHNVISKANAKLADERQERRRDQLVSWRRAHAALLNKTLKVQVGERLRRLQLWPGPIPGEDGPSPAQLISIFNYGELIHWGRHSEAYEALGADDFNEAWHRLSFLESVAALSHLYLGFSLLVRKAMQS